MSPVTGSASRAPVRPGRRALWGFLLRLRPNRLPWHRMPIPLTRSPGDGRGVCSRTRWPRRRRPGCGGAGISQILIRFFRTIPRRACWATRRFRFWALRTLRTAVPSGRVRGPPAPASSPACAAACLSGDGDAGRCAVASRRGFDLPIRGAEHFFASLVAVCVFSLWRQVSSAPLPVS